MDNIEWDTDRRIPLTLVETFERRYNVVFPSTYKSIVEAHDGAGLGVHTYVALSGGARSSFGLVPFAPNPEDAMTMDDYAETSWRTMEGLVTFGTDGGGNDFAFDFNRSSVPSVVYVDRGNGNPSVNEVASDFEGFLAAIYQGTQPSI